MSQWTEAARAELERYFTQVRPWLTATGADAEEVIDDLRRHLDAEVRAANLKVVTEDDVRRLLARIGAPQPENNPTQPIPPVAPAPAPTRQPQPIKAGVFLMVFGVILPTITLFFELVTHACAIEFFDPIPTYGHVVLVALVPIANLLVWIGINKQPIQPKNWLGWVNGAAIGVGIYYSILYAPLMLPGIIAIIFFGFGLLPLTPVIALTATLFTRKKLRGRLNGATPGLWRGVGLACLALLFVEGQPWLTKYALIKANSPERDEQLTGIRWLRAIGSEETMLRACYGYTSRSRNADLYSWTLAGKDSPSTDRAREIYFRVTGQAFNSVPAPVRSARGGWSEFDDWTWDEDHGGEKVGGRIKGLFLHSSRIDSTINADAAWSYTEWTVEFRNDSRQQREARAQLLLPPGGVVSRLTLWVNGEEREAAFAGRGETRKAYQEVAVRQRRDPVLVTTDGPDRVLMQCFPVPAGGLMKVRVGITAPLTLESASDCVMRLPIILERNFTIGNNFAHSIWAQAMPGLTCENKRLYGEPSNGGQVALRGEFKDRELCSPTALLHVTRKGETRAAWVKDTRDPENHFIRQALVEEASTAASKIVFVVDGSGAMKEHWNAIAESIEKAAPAIKRAVVIASDTVEVLESATGLKTFKPAGGQDNLPALLKAWNLAVQEAGSAIVWIHAPQPVRLDSEQALLQAVERSPTPPAIFELQTEPGPDQVISLLDKVHTFRTGLRTANLANDIARIISGLQGGSKSWRLQRSQVASQTEAEAEGAIESSLHLARLWANDNVARLRASKLSNEATKLASLYQLVTPVSGAVVLETAQQYAQAGLTPVDPQTVPAIPEPGTWVLLVVGGVGLWLARVKWRVRSSP